MKALIRYTLLIIAVATLTIPAFADAVFTLGNHPQPDEQNIMFSSKQTGTTVFGYTNQSNDLVQFSSSTDTLQVTSLGQADVFAVDGLLNNLTITVPGFYFADFILNPFNPAVDTDLNITVVMSDGTIFTFGPYGSTNGNNFLTITTINNELIASVTVDSANGFQDFRHPRVSGLVPIPEPSSLLLVGGGVLGLAGWLRRKATM